MIDITTLNTKFKRKKDVIVELLIENYGREYEQVIKDRLSNLLIDFSSLPDQEYSFLQNHGDQLNERSKSIIESRYSKYERVRKVAWEEATELIYDYAEKNLSIKCSTPEDFNILSNSDLGEGIIDSLSSKSVQILNDPNRSQLLKEDILQKQDVFREYARSKNVSITQQDIDKFIGYRKQIQTQYRIVLVEKTKFCKNIFKDFVKRWETPIPAGCYAEIVFGTDAFSRSFTITDRFEKRTVEPYIKIRYLHLKDMGCKSIDTNIVHEMIHASEAGFDSSITNEIKTQLLAIKITTQLHRMGIFILDDPDDYIIQGQSGYEMLFPLVQDFFERNEEIILDSSINLQPYKLIEYFGNVYAKFNIELNKIFEGLMIEKTRNVEPIIISNDDCDLISGLIEEMENYKYRHHSKELILAQ